MSQGGRIWAAVVVIDRNRILQEMTKPLLTFLSVV